MDFALTESQPLLTHVLPLEDGVHGFELLAKREAGKVQIAPRGA